MITFVTFNGIRITIGKWISGSELYAVLDQYDISNDDFREAVITGRLTPYDEKGTEIIHAPFSAKWTSNPPGCKYEGLEIRDVFDFCYKGDDVEKFLTSSPDAKTDEVQKDSPATNQITPEQKPAANFFTREGDSWYIGFKGQSAKGINHLDGFLYIGYLLETIKEQRKSISCSELYHTASGKTPDKVVPEDRAIAEGLYVGHRKHNKNDAQARKDYHTAYDVLQAKHRLPQLGYQPI